jgi:signal transduction histidine kinase
VALALTAIGVPMALAGCTGEGASIGGIAFVAVLLGALAAGLAYLLGRAHGVAAAKQPVAAALASGPQARDVAAPAVEAPPPPPEPPPAPNAAEQDSYSFTLSHDLRAPLRVVEGFTRIVKEDYGAQLDRVGNDHLERVLGAAARMNLMIDALLALARLSQQPLSRQPVNLSQLAGYVVDDLRRGTNERVVDADIEGGLSVTGDPTLLRLVLENLLGNAWKYTAKSASPRIEMRRESAAGAPTLAFVVRDNGAGFDMRSADRLFGLFQRLHSASDFPGHGVGLASVRRIVERHGGRVWAESEPGRGAAFHVELPA